MDQVRAVASSCDPLVSKMYGLVVKEEGNLVVSPFGVGGVMAMLSAETQVETLSEIQEG